MAQVKGDLRMPEEKGLAVFVLRQYRILQPVCLPEYRPKQGMCRAVFCLFVAAGDGGVEELHGKVPPS